MRQEDNLSPTLFNIFINDLIQLNAKPNTDPVTIGTQTLNALLYADDVVLISTSSTGLQNCINALQAFSEEWKLEINLDKTKILIFNKKEPTAPKFQYDDKEIQHTDKYTYLGIDFHEDCSFHHAITNLQDKGLKAMFKLQQLVENVTNLNTLLTIFDHTIKPILLYGSEVWGIHLIKAKNTKNLPKIIQDIHNSKFNTLEQRFYRQILRVKRNTSTTGVRGELGRHPLTIYALSNSIKYLYSIQAKPEHKLVRQALDETININPKKSWSNLVKEVEQTVNINNTPLNTLTPPTKPHVKKIYKSTIRALKSSYELYWWDQLNSDQSRSKGRGGNKLRTYSKLKQSFSFEPYLENIDNITHRKALTRLRLSSHNLNIETMRPTHKDPQTRLCPLCPCNKVENEEHFLMECTAYNSERSLLIDTCTQICPQFTNLNPHEQFLWLMTNENKIALKALGKYTWQSFDKRKIRLRPRNTTV